MKLNRTGSNWDELERNKINENWGIIEGSYNDVVEQITDEVVGHLIDSARLDWKEPVDTVADLPTSAEVGDTRMVRESVDGVSHVYRYNGTSWELIQEIDVSLVNEVDRRLSAQLAEIMQDKTIVIGDRDNKTLEVQNAIDSIAKNGKVILTGTFFLERVHLKSNITIDISEATIFCLQPNEWVYKVDEQGKDYTRTISISGVENVEVVGGDFIGSNSENDKTTAIHIGGNASNIILSGTQRFSDLSVGIGLREAKTVTADTLIGKNLKGSYVNGDLRAALVNGRNGKGVKINTMFSENSKKDCLYLGTDSAVGQNEDWEVGTIISKVSHETEGLEGYGFSNALHLRSVNGIKVGNIFVDGGYAAIDIDALTPEQTGDHIKNVKIGDIFAKKIKGREAVHIISPEVPYKVEDISIDNIVVEDSLVVSQSLGNVLIQNARNVEIGNVKVDNSIGNGIRVNNSKDVNVGRAIVSNSYQNDNVLEAHGFSARGSELENVNIGELIVKNIPQYAADFADGADVTIDKIKVRSAVGALLVLNNFDGVYVKDIEADNVDYIIAVRSNCKNVVVDSYEGKNVAIEEIRGGTNYIPPKENKFSAKRKNKIIYNPHWAIDNPPASGTWQRGDIIYNPHPIAGSYIGIVCVDGGSPGMWKGFGLIST